jgi:hypothetical protein
MSSNETQSAGETKIVVIAFQPSGSAVIKQFVRPGSLPETFGLNGSVAVGSLTFDQPPKRLQFFLEKFPAARVQGKANAPAPADPEPTSDY